VPTPYTEIQQIIAQGWPPDWADVLRRGYRMILDKENLAEQLPPVDATPRAIAKPPTAQEFDNLCNDFLYHAVWTAKKLRRGELWVAKGCMDIYMKQLLLQMIEWHTRTTHGWNYDTWHRGRFLEKWADPRITDGLKQAFAHYDETNIQDALFATINLFRWIARETAKKLEYLYPIDGDRQVTQWLEACLTEQKDRP
jgi:aminoglycoside 6-adenylyltransferase